MRLLLLRLAVERRRRRTGLGAHRRRFLELVLVVRLQIAGGLLRVLQSLVGFVGLLVGLGQRAFVGLNPGFARGLARLLAGNRAVHFFELAEELPRVRVHLQDAALRADQFRPIVGQ